VPLDQVSVTVVDEDGTPVPDGEIGEIVVQGPSLGAGYLSDGPNPSGTELADGVLRSGDAGFLRDGQLHVIGRLGDGLKVNGKMLFAEAIEAQLSARGIPPRSAVVLLGESTRGPEAVVLLTRSDPGWDEVTHQVLTEVLPPAVASRIEHVDRRAVLLTSSGKPRRRLMWRALLAGPTSLDASPETVPETVLVP
jgi:acyl-CoA synthetase (AMP-forming)/AMP-acid ligase II